MSTEERLTRRPAPLGQCCHPVRVGAQAAIKAWPADGHPPLYVLQAELLQNGKACALAEARFFSEEIAEQEGKSP